MKTKINIYFSNRKEYYRRQKISISLKRYYAERKINIQEQFIAEPLEIKQEQGVIYFINYEIADTHGYVVGSLSSGHFIPLEIGKEIIRKELPDSYSPVNFYLAEESGKQIKTKLILMREDEELIERYLNV